MGSAKVVNTKPAMEKPEKKTITTYLKALFNINDKSKVDKKEPRRVPKDKAKHAKETAQRKDTKPQNVNPLASILENFQKLDLKETNNETQDNIDESDHFTVKVIKEHNTERSNSHSSEDSGFADNKEVENFDKTKNLDKLEKIYKAEKSDKLDNTDKEEGADATKEVIEGLEKLELEHDKKKKKKLQTVVVPRGPVRHKVCEYSSSPYPYPVQEVDSYNQIHQINKHTLSGGQVIVNPQSQDNLSEVHIALKHVENQSQFYQKDEECYLEDVLEYISEDTKTFQVGNNHQEVDQDAFFNNLLEQTLPGNFAEQEFNKILYNEDFTENNRDYIYPTPPPDNISSPIESPSSGYTSNYDTTFSPELSPVYNSDYEKYQEIPHFEEEKVKKRDRTNSVSSMTMKQFKDMQKELVYNLSKKECCQSSRRSCKEIFQEHLQKLKMIERKNLCFKVAKLDLKTAFGVLHHILLSLFRGADQEDLQYALFGLVCGRILTQEPSMFAGDAGLSVLKSAALRCPHRPIFTRYLVQCVRAALRADPTLVRDKHAIFHEVDALGDHLVLACARAGDRCADVLAELVRAEHGEPTLFKTHHANSDGYTALHVACSQHSASASRLHTVHVLLEHADADLWKGDIKGGDSALHLAVNSATCDLQLVLLMFKHVDRKMWKNLAHCQNMSSVTPIEYARSAAKSTTRQNYPQEVLDFLKKCR